MLRVGRMLYLPALVGALVAGGCSQNTGGLGGVLGGVLNPAPNDQITGTVSGVDTRSQQVFISMDNGQQLALSYDNRTQVVYNGQSYPVVNLDRGDYVTARIQGTGNGGYYTDEIQVTQPVQGSGSNGSYGTYGGNYQTIEGSVSQIDYQDGSFLLRQRDGTSTVVAMPYNPRQMDVQRFNQLRNGDWVRVQGQYVSGNRFQLAGFM